MIVSICLPIFAVLFGFVARYQIRKSKDQFVGKKLAFLGLIVGWLLLVGLLLMFVLVVPSALVSANALTIAGYEKQIVLCILSANIEREAAGLTPVWPSVSSDFNGIPTDYTKVPDSETYFIDLMDSETINNLSWFTFAAAVIPEATNREDFLQGNHNIWNVIAGLDENAPDDTPFIFTRNLDISTVDLRDETSRFESKLDRKMKPLGKERVVWITKGGAYLTVRRKLFNRTLFLGSAVFNHETNKNATVLKAKGMPE